MAKPMKIVVLEDNADRRAAMQACLEDRFHQYEPRFFLDANCIIKYLRQHLGDTLVISLDHDLELQQPGADAPCTDPGTGRAVADYLAQQAPTCPIVLHSTNTVATEGMTHVLEEAGWRTYRVAPWGDLEWIPKSWLRMIRQAVVDAAKPALIRDKT